MESAGEQLVRGGRISGVRLPSTTQMERGRPKLSIDSLNPDPISGPWRNSCWLEILKLFPKKDTRPIPTASGARATPRSQACCHLTSCGVCCCSRLSPCASRSQGGRAGHLLSDSVPECLASGADTVWPVFFRLKRRRVKCCRSGTSFDARPARVRESWFYYEPAV